MKLNYEVSDFKKVSDVEIPDTFYDRLRTGIPLLDVIFGDATLPGLMRGSVITMIATPGAGKSTFTLTLAELLTNKGYKVGYASGEEHTTQIAYNCKRLKVVNTPIGNITDVDFLNGKLDDLDILIVDSFQCLSVKQKLTKTKKIEYIITNLVSQAKHKNCVIFFIVQLTSDGKIKGGTDLPYAVDVNLKIDHVKGMNPNYRKISNYKNRFGPTKDYIARLDANGYTFLGELEGFDESKIPVTPPNLPIKEKPVKKKIITAIITFLIPIIKEYVTKKIHAKIKHRK